jgi:hypothetical protein
MDYAAYPNNRSRILIPLTRSTKGLDFLKGLAKITELSKFKSFKVLESQYENLAPVASQDRYSNRS